jgi:DNA segregation ATPase FtsK/SpoIIIE, S-DNA-T family
MIGAYQPRTRRGQMADRLDDWRRAFVHAMNTALLRGAGGILFLGAAAGFVALVSYNANDPTLNNAASGDPTNLLGGLGATAADLLLLTFGLAAVAALLPPAIWGARALLGRNVTNANARAMAWPAGAVLLAAGLGLFPSPVTLPAKTGGLIGLATQGLLMRVAHAANADWIATAVPLLALMTGLALAFVATGIRFRVLWRAAAATPGLFARVGSFVRMPEFFAAHDEEDEEESDDEEDEEYEDEDEEYEEGEDEEEEDDYGLSVKPERVAAGSRSSRVKREDPKRATPRPAKSPRQPALNLGQSEYQLPALGLLAEPVRQHEATTLSDEALEENARMLEAVLGDFGVRGRIVAVRPGPVVTLYEFEPAAGVKSSRVISLADDVARSMSAIAARIAAIPGRNVMGIELPNHNRETVFLRELLGSTDYEKARAPLILALGKTIGGEPVMADLAKMPHLLIAGTTGSGKSVALNTMILSLLYRLPPEQARMIMIDPKMLELSVYEGIPHLLAPVVTDPRKAVVALKWAVREMEERYRKMSKLGVRGVEAFNERVRKSKDKGETLKRTVQTGFDRETGKPIYEDEVLELEPMPYIVVVVDEMADLMMISGKEIEGAVQRLAQMARAAGIHLIAATQRPSVDVITGTIKANFPTRISFQVTSKIDSRTILGEQGAEQLLGQGDMLYMMAGGRIKRIHGPFVTDSEVEDVVRFLKTQGTPDYLDAVTEEPDEESDDPYGLLGGNGQSGDELYDKALAIVARERKATTSYIQRRLEIGYNRAARLIERMEEEGVISKPNHQGKREVLLPDRNED